jgi:hypothetical protein
LGLIRGVGPVRIVDADRARACAWPICVRQEEFTCRPKHAHVRACFARARPRPLPAPQAKERAKREQLRKDGKLLTGKAKAEAERLAAMRAQMMAQAAEKGGRGRKAGGG